MNQHGNLALRIGLGMLMLSVFPLHSKANQGHSEDFSICQATPDSPAKRKCVKKLLPWIKSLLFDRYQPSHAKIIIQWEDYLGIKDSDYQRVLAMMPMLDRAAEIMTDARGRGMSQYAVCIQVAGYYESLGPEWKKWAEYYRKSASRAALAETP